MVCKSTNEKVPYFNAPVFLQNKTQIGKVDEIFGPTNILMFTVKVSDGAVATSFKAGDKVYIGPDKLLPMARFLQPQCVRMLCACVGSLTRWLTSPSLSLFPLSGLDLLVAAADGVAAAVGRPGVGAVAA
jgi:rRNA processing protein Gar1